MKEFPHAGLAAFSPLPDGDGQYPMEFIEARGVIKLGEEEELVSIGLTEKADAAVVASMRSFHRKPVAFYRIDASELSAYLGKKLGEERPTETGTAQAKEDGDRLLLDKLANDAPIVNLVNALCMDAIRAGASDIHLESGREEARVRYRIDGALRTVRSLDRNRFPAVSSRIKIMANLNILEKRLPQDGRITVVVGDEKTDLRVSIVPIAGGESIVLRILGKTAAPLSFGELGFSPAQESLLRALLKIPHGLVLATGPTGSGKTTTLNAMIREIASEALKVVTIEDPVEFLIPGVNQIQTNDHIKLSFDTLLRRVLRQDPNVIMVGEIRDAATAEIALRAALTGHLVLSTLHTNDAVSVVPRLKNMGVEPYLIASVLRGAIAQRLVRRLCPDCAANRPTTAHEKRLLDRYGLPSAAVAAAVGCARCGGSGFRGRVVVSEAFATDATFEEAILRGDRVNELAAYLAAGGTESLIYDGLRKTVMGITTLGELEREIALPEETA